MDDGRRKTPTCIAAGVTALAFVALSSVPASGVEVVGAGDIATARSGDTATSDLVLALAPDLVFTFGDNAYPDGTPAQFTNRYDPTWGRFKAITKPSPGNHDWHTAGAAGYTTYFGPAFPVAQLVPYETLVPGWDIYQLDTTANLGAQVKALDARLAVNPDRCEIVYGHHARWSSGEHGDDPTKQTLWSVLVRRKVDLYLTAHDHDYERFAKMDADGRKSSVGTRQVVVGTGGGRSRPFSALSAGASQVRRRGLGVLDLELLPGSYTAEFRKVRGGATGTVADSFGKSCR